MIDIEETYLDEYVDVTVDGIWFDNQSVTEVLTAFHNAIINFVHDYNHPGYLNMWGFDGSYWYAWAIQNYPHPSQSYEEMECELDQAFYRELVTLLPLFESGYFKQDE